MKRPIPSQSFPLQFNAYQCPICPYYTGKEITNLFVSVMNMLLICLFASVKLEKRQKITWL